MAVGSPALALEARAATPKARPRARPVACIAAMKDPSGRAPAERGLEGRGVGEGGETVDAVAGVGEVGAGSTGDAMEGGSL